MHIPDDPLFNEKYYFTPGDGHLDYHGEKPGEANGFKVWKTRYATIGVLICWDQWYPGGRAHHGAARRGGALLSHRDRLASGGEGRMGRRAGRGVAHDPARATRSRTASTSRRRTASATRTSRAPTASRSSAIRSSRIRSAATSPKRARAKRSSSRRAIRRSIETVRRNWPFLRDRRIDAYGPILNRYLGA